MKINHITTLAKINFNSLDPWRLCYIVYKFKFRLQMMLLEQNIRLFHSLTFQRELEPGVFAIKNCVRKQHEEHIGSREKYEK